MDRHPIKPLNGMPSSNQNVLENKLENKTDENHHRMRRRKNSQRTIGINERQSGGEGDFLLGRFPSFSNLSVKKNKMLRRTARLCEVLISLKRR